MGFKYYNCERNIVKPNQPPMYIVASEPHIGFTRNQLQLVKDSEISITKPKVDDDIENRYTVKKLLDRKVIDGEINYLVHWEGLPANQNKSWEKKSILIEDIPRLIKNMDKKLDAKTKVVTKVVAKRVTKRKALKKIAEPIPIYPPARTLGMVTRSQSRGLR